MIKAYKTQLAMVGVLSLTMLGACNNDDSDQTIIEPEKPDVAPQPLKTGISMAALQPASELELTKRIKAALYANTYAPIYIDNCMDCSVDVVLSEASPKAPTASGDDYSQTNTQESGVDEADRIEYNGTHLFVVTNPNIYYDIEGDVNPKLSTTASVEPATATLKILARQDDDSMLEVKDLKLPQGNVHGIYLAGQRLVVLLQDGINYAYNSVWGGSWMDYNYQPSHTVMVFDVTSPEKPTLLQQDKVQGYLVSSRVVDGRLYMTSRFAPSVPEMILWANTDQDKAKNYALIENTDIEQLLPTISIDGAEQQALFEADDCLMPKQSDVDDLDASLTTIMTYDIDSAQLLNGTCINSQSSGLYVSSSALYLYGSQGSQESVIHKFAFSDTGIDYQGSGNVAGNFGWSNASSYRFSEYNGHLRVLSSRGSDHKLSIFETDDTTKSLSLMSELPNEQHPEAIGKPGEAIYAVRYHGERAFIVTFQRMDPLYLLDLADPIDPKITGELEIPGYSAYLHPINENLLIGVGQQVDPNNRPIFMLEDTTAELDDIALPESLVEGAKISLFDISDPSSPKTLSELVYANSYTPVEWNTHSFTSLQQGDIYKISLPISSWHYGNDGTSLKLLEVDINANTLSETNSLVAPSNIDPWSGDDRSVLHGDNIYYLHGNDVFHFNWDQSVTALSVEDKTWRLTDIRSDLADFGHAITIKADYNLRFNSTDNTLSGKIDCNSFSGTYTATNTTVSSAGTGATEIACPLMGDDDYDLVSEFFSRVVGDMATYTLNGSELIISTAKGDHLVFSDAPLPLIEDKTWWLTDFRSDLADFGHAITIKADYNLRFNSTDNTLSGKIDCNSFSGTYTATNTTVSSAGTGATEMACPLMGDDDYDFISVFFSRVVAGMATYTLNGSELIISTAKGDHLVFSDAPLPLMVQQQALNDNIALWHNSVDSDYQFTVTDQVGLMELHKPITVTVDNGVVDSATYAPLKMAMTPERLAAQKTMMQYFEFIQETINQNVHMLIVRYDVNNGYPTSISIDTDVNIADEERYISISNFQLQ